MRLPYKIIRWILVNLVKVFASWLVRRVLRVVGYSLIDLSYAKFTKEGFRRWVAQLKLRFADLALERRQRRGPPSAAASSANIVVDTVKGVGKLILPGWASTLLGGAADLVKLIFNKKRKKTDDEYDLEDPMAGHTGN